MSKLYYLGLFAIVFLVYLLCYKGFKLLRYKMFLPFLLFILLYQFGTVQRWWTINHSNLWGVNIEITIEFVFYSFFIINSFQNPKEKKWFSIAAWAVFFFTLIDIFFIQGFTLLCSIAIVMQYALLIVLACRFFYGQMKVFDGETSLLKQPDFWVNTGLLFFSLSEFLFFSSFNMAYHAPHYFAILFDMISSVANIILYSCLIISFLCQRPNRAPSLQ